jgi:hypothetical protein
MSLGLDEIHSQMMEAINEIDVLLDSVSGGKTAGKRKITTDLMTKYNTVWEQAVGDVVTQIEGQPVEVQAALYSAFVSTLRNKFDKTSSAYIDGLVEAAPTQQALISEDEVEVYSKKRSELYAKIKTVVDLAATVSDEELPMPTSRRGSSGKRGPRNLSLFTFYIGGEEVDLTIGQIAKENGYEKAADLTAALKATGFDPREGSEFSDFELPNGKVLSGERGDEDEDEDDAVTTDAEIYESE